MGDYPHKMNWEQQQSKFSKSKWKSHWVGETSLGIWTRAHLYRQRGLGSYHSSSAWAIFDLEEVTSQLIFSCFLTWEQPSFHFIVWRIEWGTTHSWVGPCPLGHVLFAFFTLEPVPGLFLFLYLCKTCFVLEKNKRIEWNNIWNIGVSNYNMDS